MKGLVESTSPAKSLQCL